EKKNKVWLEREEVIGFEVDESLIDATPADKPMAAPEGTGKKKAKKKRQNLNADIWGGFTGSD
ncbi:hypothetical protein A9Q73_02375, partial [Bermanella sp. 47_1433_sub80_T6]